MKPPKGLICVAYRPKSGHPRNADGRLILVYEFAKPGAIPVAEPPSRRGIAAAPPVKRSAARPAATQGALL